MFVKRGLQDLRGRRVFVTGAAGGIGRAVAGLAAAQGAELYLTDIDDAGLQKAAAEIGEAAQVRAAGGGVRLAKAADISDFAKVSDLAREIHAEAGPMDVIMNVAGISTWGTVENLENRHWRSMIEVNLMGPIHVMELFLPPMIEAGRGGHLANVSSAAGLVGLPWHAAYSASKYGLRGVSEVLRFDLRRHGIGVSLVCPGAVNTPLTETAEIVGVDRESPVFRRFLRRFRERAATPEQAARDILNGVRRNRYLVHTSGSIRALHLVERTCPPLYAFIMQRMNDTFTRVISKAAPMGRP